MIWDPRVDHYSHQNFLTLNEVEHVLTAILAQDVTPFVFTFEPGGHHAIYHTPLQNETEERLAREFVKRSEVAVLPAAQAIK